jgi:acetyl esterase/lipase
MDLRKVIPVLVVVAIALGVAGLALTLRDDGDDSSDDRTSSASSTTTSTTAATTTTSTTLPPSTSPPATSPAVPNTALPPGTVVEVPPTEAPTTTAPPDTAADDTTPDTTAPATTVPDDDDDDDDEAADRDTVVYSPPGAPARRGDLLVPDEHESTAIVLIHGGRGTRGSRRNVRAWADEYAQAGYLTFSIDYLLFKDTTPSPVFPDPERDVKAAVQYLRQHADELGIDPDRIVVQGFSAGARLGAEAYTSAGDPYFAGEGLYDDGTSDVVNGFIGFYGPYDGKQAEAEQYYGGPPDSDDPEVQERYARSDSVAHAADAEGPALLFQGDADQLVPVTQASAFADALDAAGKDATLVVVPGAEHGFDREGRQLTPEGEQALADILDWLAENFPET